MLIGLHIAAALAALAVGSAVLARRKGTPSHRLLGAVWVALMAVAAFSSFWIFVRAHKAFMIGTFLGLAGAGVGALAPGRALYRFLFA